MEEHTVSILFLIFVPLFILGFIGAIIFVIVKSIKTKRGLQQIATQNNWQFYKDLSLANNNELEQLLEISIYKIQQDRFHFFSNIIKGKYNEMDFWFGYYSSRSKRGNTKNRAASQFNIYIVKIDSLTKELILFYKTKMMKFLKADKLSALLGHPLYTPVQQGCEWLMVTNLEYFESLNLNISDIEKLKNAMEGAHSLMLFNGFFIYAVQWNTTISPSKFNSYLPKVLDVKNILTSKF